MRSLFTKSLILILIAATALFVLSNVSASENDPSSVSTLQKVKKSETPDLMDGDIIFQSSTSGQSMAIQLATHSKYSHVGILFEVNGKWMVFEAVQPVKWTPLKQWITHGDDNEYFVKRHKNADQVVTQEVIAEMKKLGKSMEGKDYDIYFNWSDDQLYCSELVWKLYKRTTGVEIGPLRPLSDFDLSSELVKKTMQQRYGNQIPYDELMISPGDIFDNDDLITIHP